MHTGGVPERISMRRRTRSAGGDLPSGRRVYPRLLGEHHRAAAPHPSLSRRARATDDWLRGRPERLAEAQIVPFSPPGRRVPVGRMRGRFAGRVQRGVSFIRPRWGLPKKRRCSSSQRRYRKWAHVVNHCAGSAMGNQGHVMAATGRSNNVCRLFLLMGRAGHGRSERHGPSVSIGIAFFNSSTACDVTAV